MKGHIVVSYKDEDGDYIKSELCKLDLKARYLQHKENRLLSGKDALSIREFIVGYLKESLNDWKRRKTKD